MKFRLQIFQPIKINIWQMIILYRFHLINLNTKSKSTAGNWISEIVQNVDPKGDTVRWLNNFIVTIQKCCIFFSLIFVAGLCLIYQFLVFDAIENQNRVKRTVTLMASILLPCCVFYLVLMIWKCLRKIHVYVWNFEMF